MTAVILTFWSHSEQLKTPILIIKVNVLSVKQMITVESIKKKKKQALLTLHSKDSCYCTSTVLQLYNCFVLYLPVFLFFVKHFWYNISILYVAYLKKHYYSGHELHLPLVFRAINGSKFIFLVRPHTSIQNAHACIYTEVHTLFFENWHRVSHYKLKSYKFCDYVDCVVCSLVWLASSIVGQDE